MSGALGTHPGKTGKVSAEWNQADGLHSEYLDAGAGGQALKISVTLILAASEAKALSRKTAHWGREAAMSRMTVSGTPASKQAARTPPSTRWTVQPPTTRLVWGRWMPRPWSSRQA